MNNKNIFSALSKYNSATDENYLTEAFVFLLNSLLERERQTALDILTRLCVEDQSFSFGEDEEISISTQEVTEQGTPDIKISSPDKLIYVEVKHDSPLGPQQIERYKKALDSSTKRIKCVILLTRFSIDSEEQSRPHKHVRWFEVYNWLEKAAAQDPVSKYLIDSFNSFLEEKRMSIQKVGAEYVNGIPAFNNILNMIEVAIENANIPTYPTYPRAASWDSKGFWLGDKEYWCGIYYNNHLIITFEIIDKSKYDKSLNTSRYEIKKGRERIWFRLPLGEIDFFSLDKDKQQEEITKFVKTAYAQAQQMCIK